MTTLNTAYQEGPLEVRFEEIGLDAIVVHLSGRLDLAGLLALRRVLRRLAVTRPWIVLNLAGVPEFHASTAAVLIRAQQGLRRQGGHLALWQLRGQPRQLVEDKRLSRILDVVRGDLTGWLAARSTPSSKVSPDEPAGPRSRAWDGVGHTEPAI